MNIVQIQDNEKNIKIYESENANNVLIAIHGFTSSLESPIITMLGESLTKQRCTVLAFDLPRHGKLKSNKPLDLYECFDMLCYIENFARDKYNLPVSYFATSFGGYLLLNHLHKNNEKYNKIILRAPAVFMSEILEEEILKENGCSCKDLNNDVLNLGYEKPLFIDKKFLDDLKQKTLSDFKCENFLHIFQGKKDDVVDFMKNEEFFRKYTKENYKFYYFENADHRFKKPGELEQIVEIVVSLLIN